MQRTFADRDLSNVDYVYLWADGIHVKRGGEDVGVSEAGQRHGFSGFLGLFDLRLEG
ncbi:hypothetical protein [Microtetraspora fusca]|uniref:Uncharacterized protein n=1 Tax=Microtetraspora fusca TaxID=1997 RepID=A0ABW6VK80_MICFU|nr:hypothetical protein [Microtetraspora fusca]